MEIYNENIQYENPFLSMKIFEAFRDVDTIGSWHYHKEIEILLILEGSLDVFVDEEHYSLNEGDVILIGSAQLHRDRSPAHALRYLVFQFDLQNYMEQSTMPYYRFFSESEVPLSRLNYIFEDDPDARKQIHDCVREIYAETQAKQDGYEIAVSMLIKRIVLTLMRRDSRRLLNLRDNADLLRLKPVLEYIDANIAEKIQVEEASRVANVSYYYFVKYFKKALGMSFLEYVNYKKIKFAERILLTKDVSIAQVGEAVGMPNMAHFYKVFKKYNRCSPNDFRKKMSELTR